MKNNQPIHNDVADYYTSKLKEHGPTPQGVDWNSEESQNLRFRQVTKVINFSEQSLSVLDYGCGVGALYTYLSKYNASINYTGFDISDKMIETARNLYGADSVSWSNTLDENKQYDYVVSSGIFNVRLEHTDSSWIAYIKSTLKEFDSLARKGFAFNMLTGYSDREHMRDYLYYADPGEIFDFCKRNFSRQVALLHDYPLYEFTILVRKE